ncbi:MAG TPA: hypothetical protein VMG33_01340 [Steroidobacteraceae bacterium]|nr:hypothetical protein [Steroidobacteraceae bacterium]
MSKILTGLIAAAALSLLAAGNAIAGSGYLRVVVVKTDNVAAYMQELDKGRAMMKKLGINVTLRIWKATYAGPETGTVVVSQEYASFAAFAEAQSKSTADAQFAAWIAGLDKVRTIVSDSLYREL